MGPIRIKGRARASPDIHFTGLANGTAHTRRIVKSEGCVATRKPHLERRSGIELISPEKAEARVHAPTYLEVHKLRTLHPPRPHAPLMIIT